MGHELIGLVAVTGLFLIPSLAIAGHLVVRPLLETYLKARGLSKPHDPADDARLARLEEQMSQMQERLDRLGEVVEFDRQLHASRSGSAPQLPPSTPAGGIGEAR